MTLTSNLCNYSSEKILNIAFIVWLNLTCQNGFSLPLCSWPQSLNDVFFFVCLFVFFFCLDSNYTYLIYGSFNHAQNKHVSIVTCAIHFLI